MFKLPSTLPLVAPFCCSSRFQTRGGYWPQRYWGSCCFGLSVSPEGSDWWLLRPFWPPCFLAAAEAAEEEAGVAEAAAELQLGAIHLPSPWPVVARARACR